ncbi:AfsR/SARP family transcriptional regulator [Streptomyces sp. NPDC017260]|uniref:AfsR/SARP family transcriptional regulator n=1 Tax=unclassified Streptomyces TaxID=2593676 RepID=UPI00379FEBA9
MRFEVLGPLTVRTDDGDPVPVTEPKVRALLADLLVHHGRPVPVDRLIDDLWGEAVPGNPVNSLQTKVSQLRRTLAGAESGARALVEYGPAGYALRVAADAVDSGRFGRLTARAREETDPRTKASLLSQALGLWRGAAFSEFRDSGFAQAAIAGLDEQRLTAREELAELRLETVGRAGHSALADELGLLTGEHPLRQRLRAAHMRALYLAGRQSEALAAYRDLERRYADELGIDPSADVTELHQAMLRQDPGLVPGPCLGSGSGPGRGLAPGPVRGPGPGAGSVPGPAAPVGGVPRTNLPTPVSSLVGREETVTRLCALLEHGRLVTLTGPGGVGKTRLALEAAARLTERGPGAHPDGVWFVELAGATAEVAETVAAALGIRDDAAQELGFDTPGNTDDPVLRLLVEALRPRRMLLVLDNCEHVVGPVAALAAHLLRRAPGVRVLATSQEPLALSGEVLHAVAPLAEAEAVELFAARAAAAAPGFVLGPENTEAVALVCRRLDGIPLALELAAPRVRALGVHALADRLHDRFRLLGQVRRDAPARQRTLRAMIDWSWEPLSPAERTVLRRLSVFAGGFTLESAEAVCAVGDAPEGDETKERERETERETEGRDIPEGDVRAEEVLDIVTRLVDRSLLVPAYATDRDDGTRYRMLESVAAYGLDRLADAGETQDVRHRHALHFAGLAAHAEPLLYGRDQRRLLHRLDSETLNLRAALDHAAVDGSPGLGLRMANSLTWYWYLRGRMGEAVRSLGRALEYAHSAGGGAVQDPVQAAARVRRAALSLLTGDDSWLGESFDGADARGRWLLVFARCGFLDRSEESLATGTTDGTAEGARGGTAGTARTITDEFRGLGDRWGEAAALGTRATQALYQGDLDAVRRYAEQSAALFTGLGDRWGRLQASELLGVIAEVCGGYGAAARLHQDGVRGAEELQLWSHMSFRLSRLGRIALLTGDYARAAELHERARRLAAEQSHRSAEQFAETGLALGARRSGDPDTAEALLTPWLEWNRRLGVDSGAALVLAQLGYVAEQRGDARRAEALHRDGLTAALRTRDPRAVALAMEGLAGARSATPRPGADAARFDSHGYQPDPAASRPDPAASPYEQAASLLGTAAALRDSAGAPLPRAERIDVDRAAGRARAVLGEAAFTAAHARGRALTAQDQVRLLGPSPDPCDDRA